MGGSWDIPNTDCKPGKSKWLTKETWNKCPIEVLQTSTRAWPRDSGSLPKSTHVSTHTYGAFFPLDEYSTWFTTFCLCGNSFLQRQKPGPLLLTTGLVARIWCSHRRDAAQSLAGNPSPAQRFLRPRPPRTCSIRAGRKKGRKVWFWRWGWGNYRVTGVFTGGHSKPIWVERLKSRAGSINSKRG